MGHVFANKTVGIGELKVNPGAVLSAARTQPVAIFNRNKPAGYLVNPQAWEVTLERLGDAELTAIALARLSEGSNEMEVSLDALWK